MPTLDTANLNPILQADINALTTANSSTDIVGLAKSVATQTANRIVTVDNVGQLPDIDTVLPTNPGQMVFVKSVNALVYADSTSWRGLDGRTLRKDYCTLIFSWGDNSSGHLGDGTLICRSSPVSVVGGFTDWKSIDGQTALKTNRTLWAWGSNTIGSVGDGTINNRNSPVSVVGGFTDWCYVDSSSGIRTNGTLWTWGFNQDGRLGDDTTTSRSSPVSVVGGFTDWCQVNLAGTSAGIRTNGTLWTWGSNDVGRLGINLGLISCSRSSPGLIVGGFTDWRQVSVGSGHIIALRSNGTLWAWGCNADGRVGDGTDLNNRSSPVSVFGGYTDWCQVSAGYVHSAAIRTNGTLWTWGSNSFGELGRNNLLSTNQPTQIVGGFTDWCQVSAGIYFTGAIRTNGTLWTWGTNASGQLGQNVSTAISQSSPVSVVGGFTDWCQVSISGSTTTAIRKLA